MIFFGYTLALLFLNTMCTPIVEYAKGVRYEEYTVEHEISATQAKNAVLSIDLNSIVISPSCQQCTQDEVKYCLGSNLINDHCCCDMRYTEVLPFIPHTCYLGRQLCEPVIGNCDKYRLIFNCCCKKHVLQKWKDKSSAEYYLKPRRQLFVIMFLYIFVNYYYY